MEFQVVDEDTGNIVLGTSGDFILMKYGNDYSSIYDDRTLIDKGFARWVNKQQEQWRYSIKGSILHYFAVRREHREMKKQKDRIFGLITAASGEKRGRVETLLLQYLHGNALKIVDFTASMVAIRE